MSAHRIHPAVVHVGVILVGAATLTLSAYFQWQLGMLAGSIAVAATLPVALDVGGAVAGVCWISGTGALRRWGAGISIAQVLASTAVNVLAHGLLHGWPWAPLGVVYPVVFFSMVKLELLHQEQTRDLADATVELTDAVSMRDRAQAERGAAAQLRAAADADRDAAEETQRAASELRQSAESDAARTKASGPRQSPAQSKRQTRSQSPRQTALRNAAERREWIAQQLRAGRDVTGADVKQQFPDATNAAREVKAVKDEHEQAPRLAVAR